jgi:predicted lysophospholipase L1 biosynthesis ABC-type transport system permease subunit
LLGRGFNADDRVGSPRVAVVNETFAREHFGGGSPIGKRIWGNPQRSGEPFEIVGVVKDSKYRDPRETTTALAFLSFEQSPGPGVQFAHIRIDGSPQSALPQIRTAIREVDPKLRVAIETVEQSFDRTITLDITGARLSGVFGVLALLLACLGVYGVISYIVTTRTAEIGIRLAIGARPTRVLREVIGQAIRTVIPGILAGIGLSFVAERSIETLLFDFVRRDPIPYVAVAAGLLIATGVAAFVPARRASRIDPAISLRCD